MHVSKISIVRTESSPPGVVRVRVVCQSIDCPQSCVQSARIDCPVGDPMDEPGNHVMVWSQNRAQCTRVLVPVLEYVLEYGIADTLATVPTRVARVYE